MCLSGFIIRELEFSGTVSLHMSSFETLGTDVTKVTVLISELLDVFLSDVRSRRFETLYAMTGEQIYSVNIFTV